MTPQKIMRSTTSSHCSDADVSMEADESNVPSPPRSTLRSRTRHGGAAASRLFSDQDDDDEQETSHHRTTSKVAVLKPLDLNLELLDTDEAVNYDFRNNAASTTMMGRSSFKPQSHDPHHRPHHYLHQRKRSAEQQLQGRDLSFDDEANSPVDMYTSPRISPSSAMSYKSPASHAPMNSSSHKSPLSSFRTMDGRTVQSKNPFSPMNMEGVTPQPNRRALPIADSLTFPVMFEVDAESSKNKKENSNNALFALPSVAPLLRQPRLHKRDSLLDESSTARSVSYHYNSFTRDGYPNRTGQYSFTGSPIRENTDIIANSNHHNQETTINYNMSGDEDTNNHNKVRRFTKGDDVVVASQHDVHYRKKKTNSNKVNDLQVDTSFINFYGNHAVADEISPTDVLSFPMISPPSAMPPTTPSKQPQQRHALPDGYPPLRRAAGPPQTPMIDRSRRTPARSRSFDQDSDQDNNNNSDDSSSQIQQQQIQVPQSRFYSDFDIIGDEELGKGSFGCVYKVLSRLDGCMYAVKAAHRPAKGTADKDRMLKEVYALAALSDQADTATFHIVRYHQAWMEENRLYIQTELCTSTLTAELKAGRLATEQRRYKFLREICLALEFIHRNGMVHLDIKPENIFLKNDQFKLGDFGLVSKIASHNDVEEGDSRYMSMELLSGDHGDLTKSDIFSLGISLYEVCLDGKPLPTDGDVWQALRSAKLPPLSNVPDEMQRIMRLMMNPSHTQRPTAIDLLELPQLLSDEQKALMAEKNKVLQANMALLAQERQLRMLAPALPAKPRKGGLVRANTWNGGF